MNSHCFWQLNAFLKDFTSFQNEFTYLEVSTLAKDMHVFKIVLYCVFPEQYTAAFDVKSVKEEITF